MKVYCELLIYRQDKSFTLKLTIYRLDKSFTSKFTIYRLDKSSTSKFTIYRLDKSSTVNSPIFRQDKSFTVTLQYTDRLQENVSVTFQYTESMKVSLWSYHDLRHLLSSLQIEYCLSSKCLKWRHFPRSLRLSYNFIASVSFTAQSTVY